MLEISVVLVMLVAVVLSQAITTMLPFAGNYSPPHRYEKFIPISPIAKRRNFESDGGSEPVRSVFGLGSVTFQKRRPKRLRDWPHDWRLAHNYYQRGGGSILA